MGKTIEELRSSEHVGRASRSHPVCVAQKLTDKYGRLSEVQSDLIKEQVALLDELDERTAAEKPSSERSADAPDERAEEIEARLAEIAAELDDVHAEQDSLAALMEDHTGDVGLVAMEPGEWQRWRNAHPPRDAETSEGSYDRQFARNYCNADALINDLARWAKTWNGAPFAEGQWEWVADKAPGGALKTLALLVIDLQEGEMVVPKSRRASSTTPSE